MIGAQNCSDKESGAFTGEISPKMLLDINLDMVILGHSERRELYNETNDIVKLKSKNALKNNLKVIICVGESLSQKKNGKTLRVIGEQLKKSVPEKISSKPSPLKSAAIVLYAKGCFGEDPSEYIFKSSSNLPSPLLIKILIGAFTF